jgi:hypothetical protein
MIREFFDRLGTFLGLALITTLGCGGAGAAGGGAHMALPSDFSKDLDQLTIQGRSGSGKEPFEFGPYQVDRVEPKSFTATDFDMFDNFEPAEEGGYRFSLAGGKKEKLTGKCAQPAPKKTEDLDGTVIVQKQSALACWCELGKKSVAELFLEDFAGEYAGKLVIGEVSARASAVYKLENGDKLEDRPAGYRVDDDGGPVAAIDALPGEGRVWIKHGLQEPERQRLVCGLVGMRLWDPPSHKQNK